MGMDIYLHTDINKGRISLLTYPANEEKTLHGYLTDMISHIQKKDNLFINFYGLSVAKDLVFNELYRMGYNPIRTTRKKDMRVKDFRYGIGRDKCYYIQIQVMKDTWITFQNVECIIGSDDLTLSGDEIFPLFYKVKDFYMDGLKRQNRILYTISGMSRNLFTRVNPDYAKSFNIVKGYSKKVNGKPINEFLEDYCRPSVRGGFMYLSNGISYNGAGISLDVNSIYPYVSRETSIPTTQFIGAYNGAPEKEKVRGDLYYIYKVRVYDMKVKSIPCICRDSSLTGTNYITDAKKVKLTLTEVDMKLLEENYTYSKVEYLSYVVFGKSSLPFKKYFGMLYEYKKNSQGIERQVPKLFMNSFIGGLMRRAYVKEDVLEAEEDGFLHTKARYLTKDEIEKQKRNISGLCYIGAGILAAARYYIIKKIKSIPEWEDRWLYTDTDSIYLKGTDIPDQIEISDRMGAFKVEHEFTDCVFYGNKQYILSDKKDGLVCKLAGIPQISRKMMVSPKEWIYTEKHSRYYEKQALRAIEKHHLSRLFSQKLPIIYSYIDYETEEIGYHIQWKKIVDYKKRDRKKYEYSDFHRLNGSKESDDDIKTEKAIKEYNEHVEQYNPEHDFYKAVYILQLLKSGVPPTKARWQYLAVRRTL